LQDYLFLDPLNISNNENIPHELTPPSLHCLSRPEYHVFYIKLSNMMLTPDQQRVFHVILQNPTGLHVLTGTPGSGKTFFVKYLAQYFQTQNKLVLLSTATSAAALRLSSTASTTHSLFRIPSRGYLSPLPEPSTVLERLHSADVIVIDEMSMMTSYMLCTVEHRLKQACRDTISNTFCNKLVLLVGDLAQLPAICVHAPKLRGDTSCFLITYV
jgi:ATP-dependent exoDNAse (exonuclease V) alpha subunit